METFNHTLLKLLRERLMYTQKTAAAKVGVTQAVFSKYEHGKATPSDEVINKIAHVFSITKDFLKQPQTDVFSGMIHHRKRSALSATLRDAIEAEAMLRIQDTKKMETFVHKKQPPIRRFPFPSESAKGCLPDEIARKIRAQWKMLNLIPTEDGPILNLFECIESLGITIISFDFGTDKLDGFFLRTTNSDYIALNTNDAFPADRQRFTAAHELGHALMHREVFPGKQAEDEANYFASELLAPAQSIMESLTGINLKNLESLKTLKQTWWISIAALARRARDLKLVAENAYRNFCINLNVTGMRKHEPDCGVSREIPNRVPSLLLLANHYLAQSDKRIEDLLNISPALFAERYPKAGEVPTETLS